MISPDVLKLYRDLADGLSDMMEGGRLTEADVPDDWDWLNTLVQHIAVDDPGTPSEDFRDHEDDRCRTCGDYYADGGDGFDGECPECADKTAAAEGDE